MKGKNPGEISIRNFTQSAECKCIAFLRAKIQVSCHETRGPVIFLCWDDDDDDGKSENFLQSSTMALCLGAKQCVYYYCFFAHTEEGRRSEMAGPMYYMYFVNLLFCLLMCSNCNFLVTLWKARSNYTCTAAGSSNEQKGFFFCAAVKTEIQHWKVYNVLADDVDDDGQKNKLQWQVCISSGCSIKSDIRTFLGYYSAPSHIPQRLPAKNTEERGICTTTKEEGT